MSLTKVSYSMIYGASVNVLDYGADPTGTADSTSAIQAAVDANAGYVSIYFPTGTYKVTSTITFSDDRYFVYGDGASSKINFEPTANDDCFVFENGSSASVQNVIRDLAFYSNDTTYDKRAIVLTDVSENLVENVQTIYPHWSGGSNYSTFLRIQGRDTTAIRGLNVSADIPIEIRPIPAPHVSGGIGIDHFHFQDCYLICMKAAKSVVQINSGVNLTHVTFDGYQAWIGGNYGLYWEDSATTGVSIALTVKNVRWEQQAGTTGYFVYIKHNYGLQQCTLENLYGASATNGFYFAKVSRINLKQILYIGTQMALAADANSNYITFDNVFFNDASATVSISSKGHSGTYWLGGNGKTYLPDSPTGSLVQSINKSSVTGYSQLTPVPITVNNGAAIQLCNEFTSSTLIVNAGNATASAIYQIKSTNHATAILAESLSSYWGTSAGAYSVNIYWDGSQYVVQNLTGGTLTLYIVSIG